MIPIVLLSVGLSFSHKICFEDFSASLPQGARCGLMGRNGCGKSTLLRMILGQYPCSQGDVILPAGLRVAYVPQNLCPEDGEGTAVSGGEFLWQALCDAFSQEADALFLDEPGNHLDEKHFSSLIRMIAAYPGTLVMVSHDKRLLRQMTMFWHIRNGSVSAFHGNFDDYVRLKQCECFRQKQEESRLRKRKKEIHMLIQNEKEKNSSSNMKKKGVKKFGNDRMQRNTMKGWSEGKTGKIARKLGEERDLINRSVQLFRVEETIKYRFHLESGFSGGRNPVTIVDGILEYAEKVVLSDINLSIENRERVALYGGNGSGKTTFLKALTGAPGIVRKGEWYLPPIGQMAFLDQHYAMLQEGSRRGATVLECMRTAMPQVDQAALRQHLNDFLFRGNEDVLCPVRFLSGGERVRLCLALLAVRLPRVLLLDEVTNSLDEETMEHIISVLKDFQGTLIVVSHDEFFMNRIGITSGYNANNGCISYS